MITPADSPSAPEQYAAMAVARENIQAPLDDLTGLVAAAGALSGADVLYPIGPRQHESAVMLNSPEGFGLDGYDINAGYHGMWPNDVEPTVAGP
jgi:hypothetical protein